MDDYTACAEVCEARGFPRQAGLLRAVARGQLHVHAVAERPHVDDEYLSGSGGTPLALYCDRAEAERDARDRNLRAFRERNLFDYCYNYLEDTTDLDLPELERRIGEALGRPYTLPEPEGHAGPFFPADATDAQMRAVMELFTLRFFYVAEVALSG